MSKSVSYLLCIIIYDVFLLNASHFYALDFLPPIIALLFFSKKRIKTCMWLFGLNLFIIFIVLSFVLNKDYIDARNIFIRSNLILLLTISLLLEKNQFFLIKAVYNLKFPQKMIAILVINQKLFEYLFDKSKEIPATIKARGVKMGTNMMMYKAYANLIGRLICTGFDRSFEIYSTMKIRGYKTRIDFLADEKANYFDIFLMILVVLTACFRLYKYFG